MSSVCIFKRTVSSIKNTVKTVTNIPVGLSFTKILFTSYKILSVGIPFNAVALSNVLQTAIIIAAAIPLPETSPIIIPNRYLSIRKNHINHRQLLLPESFLHKYQIRFVEEMLGMFWEVLMFESKLQFPILVGMQLIFTR